MAQRVTAMTVDVTKGHEPAVVVDQVTAAAIEVMTGEQPTPGMIKLDEIAFATPTTPASPAKFLLDSVTSICVVSAFRQAQGKDGEEGFEGNEKRLQIDLKPDGSTGPLPFTRQFWDELLELVSAKILDMKSNGVMEGYILSESSLFVSANRITLITCGTTVLLGCMQKLVDGIRDLGRVIEYLQYSRKDFTYPWQQPAEHRSIASEYTILHQHAPDGAPFILGPLDSDHYFMYVMDNITRPSRDEVDMQLNMVMYNMADDVSKFFFSPEVSGNSTATAALRQATGLDKLFGHCEVIQDQVWTPCGYSANAFTGEEYWTTHITPEKHCSYASFETNALYETYTPIVSQVLGVFRPERCCLIALLDEESPGGRRRRQGKDIGLCAYPGYVLTGRTINEFGPGYYVIKLDLQKKDP
eukprot:GGOE01030341.1.p1 GENE.GGOE01030341.1~~GGOE01030341.1.p1  ORF type:complete len:433 (+),score=153.55 GGOE01030341.1:59-1300(+)